MHRVFTEGDVVPGLPFTVTGDRHRHMALSLRMRPGEKLVLCRGGVEYEAVITAINREETIVLPGAGAPSENEPGVRVTLFVGMPKGDKLEQIIKKATEIGAAAVVPFISERSVSRPEEKSMRAKLDRWKKIAEEAAAQSRRGLVPEVFAPVSFESALSSGLERDLRLFCHEGEGTVPLSSAVDGESLSVAAFTGPEGGFSPEECDRARSRGCRCVGLGKRILRCETAPLFLLSALMLAYNEC